MTAGDRFGASLPRSAARASWKSPVETPRRYKTGSRASRLRVRRAHFGKMLEENRTRSAGSEAPRSRMRTRENGTGPMPGRLSEQAAGPDPQHLGQGIVDRVRLTEPDDVG